MNRRMTTLALAALLAVATPVLAQPPGTPGQSGNAQTETISAQDAGSCATAAGCATFFVGRNYGSTINISGAFTGTLTFEYEADGSNWRSLIVTNVTTGASATTTTAAGTFSYANVGLRRVRVRAGTFTPGVDAVVVHRVGYSARSNVTSPTFGDVTTTGQFLAANGSAALPSYSFVNNPNTGWYRASSLNIVYSSNATPKFGIIGDGSDAYGQFRLGSDWCYGFSASSNIVSAAADASLCRAGAYWIAQRNGTNAQRFDVDNTWTSTTNFERFSIDWQYSANVAVVGTRAGTGGGTGRDLRLVAQDPGGSQNGGGLINLKATATPFVQIDKSQITDLGSQGINANGNYFQIGGAAGQGGASQVQSGQVNWFAIMPRYVQGGTGSAANTDVLINRQETTAPGSGAQKAIEYQVGGTARWTLTTGAATGRGMTETFTQSVAPTCSTNCGTSPSVTGSDRRGRIVMGATGSPASGFVLTFNGTYANRPTCAVWMSKAGMVTGKKPITVVETTGQFTVVTDGTAPGNSDEYSYDCVGIQ